MNSLWDNRIEKDFSPDQGYLERIISDMEYIIPRRRDILVVTGVLRKTSQGDGSIDRNISHISLKSNSAELDSEYKESECTVLPSEQHTLLR